MKFVKFILWLTTQKWKFYATRLWRMELWSVLIYSTPVRRGTTWTMLQTTISVASMVPFGLLKILPVAWKVLYKFLFYLYWLFIWERVNIAQIQNCTRGLNCTSARNCTKTILHQGSILHKLHFCTRVNKKEQKTKNKKKFKKI